MQDLASALSSAQGALQRAQTEVAALAEKKRASDRKLARDLEACFGTVQEALQGMLKQAQQEVAQLLAKMAVLEKVPSPTFFKGIQTDLAIGDLEGWTVFVQEPYSHKTKLEDLTPPAELEATSLIVGAKRRGTDVLAVAAMGEASRILQPSSAQDQKLWHNGVHWFNWEVGGVWHPFGFVSEESVDSSRMDNMRNPLHLQWRVDGDAGGSVAAADGWLHSSTEWEKVVLAGRVEFED